MWRKHALCQDYDPEIFFPISDEDSIIGDFQWSRAKSICAACPVQQSCLDHALRTKQRFGVWGGKTETERRAILWGMLV